MNSLKPHCTFHADVRADYPGRVYSWHLGAPNGPEHETIELELQPVEVMAFARLTLDLGDTDREELATIAYLEALLADCRGRVERRRNAAVLAATLRAAETNLTITVEQARLMDEAFDALAELRPSTPWDFEDDEDDALGELCTCGDPLRLHEDDPAAQADADWRARCLSPGCQCADFRNAADRRHAAGVPWGRNPDEPTPSWA